MLGLAKDCKSRYVGEVQVSTGLKLICVTVVVSEDCQCEQ